MSEPTQTDIVVQCQRRAIVACREALRLMDIACIQADVAGEAFSAATADTLIEQKSDYLGSAQIYAGEAQAMDAAFRALRSQWNLDEVRLLHAKFVGAVNLGGMNQQ